MTTSSTTPLSIYQLRIVLRGISPLIWRRVLVPSKTTLAHLHAILQILFAWSDEHLHSFHIHGKEYGGIVKFAQFLAVCSSSILAETLGSAVSFSSS
jgi:Plasmid pRiA4b ORF-3-like protein